MIEIKNLNKTFKTKNNTTVALCDVSLKIETGEIYGIIGLSGAGKSTLIRCVNLLERPDSGAVIIDGHDITLLNEKQLRAKRKNIAMIFQNFNLLEQRSVLKNVTLPLELMGMKTKDAEKKASELIKLVGLEEKIFAYPSQLSGGQKQRVAIARALATDPKYLLCDEATSALDPKTTDSILALLKVINEKFGITIVIITHEMRVIEQICDKVAVIDGGKIVESGNVVNVFTSPKSDISKRLVLPKLNHYGDKMVLRIVFNGEESSEPIVSRLITELNIKVNILFADIKELGDKNYGHMTVSFNCEKDKLTASKWFNKNNIIYTEE